MLSEKELAVLRSVRRELHQHPELSGQERQTSGRIIEHLLKVKPDELHTNIGGYGVLAKFAGKSTGPVILVRVDMDALPIQEVNQLAYKSERENTAHLCGHDGHTTIGLGLAQVMAKEKPQGDVFILFQPAEETGEGAHRVMEDPVFKQYSFDKIIALHNLPGFPLHQVVVRDGPFASASVGLLIQLKGWTSHAAEPEMGLNPVDAFARIIQFLEPYRAVSPGHPLQLATIVQLSVGELAFGTNAGKGVLGLTLRAETDKLLDELKEKILFEADRLAGEYGLSLTTQEREYFAATINENGFTYDVRNCAEQSGLTVKETEKAFRWSEDVGRLTSEYGGGMFGLGAGVDQPPLHNPAYDFPDDLIISGVRIFYDYIKLQNTRYAANLTH